MAPHGNRASIGFSSDLSSPRSLLIGEIRSHRRPHTVRSGRTPCRGIIRAIATTLRSTSGAMSKEYTTAMVQRYRDELTGDTLPSRSRRWARSGRSLALPLQEMNLAKTLQGSHVPKLVQAIHAQACAGKYTNDLFRKRTKKPLDRLWAEYSKAKAAPDGGRAFWLTISCGRSRWRTEPDQGGGGLPKGRGAPSCASAQRAEAALRPDRIRALARRKPLGFSPCG